jgi:hypothetical protein
MKAAQVTGLFAGIAAAHSAVWKVTADGNEYGHTTHQILPSLTSCSLRYPARDVRIDNFLGAKRIEWKFTNAFNFAWHAITDVESPGFACGC